jgi:hypothetical protein
MMQKPCLTLLSGALFLCLAHISECQTRYGGELGVSILTAVNSRNNILYAGIDNEICVDYSGLGDDIEYVLTVNNGIVFPESPDYIAIPDRSGKARFLVFGIKGTDTTLIGYRYFQVENIPEPLLVIDSLMVKENDMVSKQHFLNSDSLGIFISDDIVGAEDWFKIIKFTLGYVYGGYYVEHTNNTNKISRETKQIIYTIGPSKEIIIKPTVEGEGNLIKDLPIFRLTLY